MDSLPLSDSGLREQAKRKEERRRGETPASAARYSPLAPLLCIVHLYHAVLSPAWSLMLSLSVTLSPNPQRSNRNSAAPPRTPAEKYQIRRIA